MRKLIALAGLAAVALTFVPASAGPSPLPNSCLIAGGGQSDGTGTETCSFVVADVPAHGFVGLTPNDFVIFADGDGDNQPDPGEIRAEVSPSGMDPIAGQFEAEAGETLLVHLSHGCVQEPGCGWVGALLVG